MTLTINAQPQYNSIFRARGDAFDFSSKPNLASLDAFDSPFNTPQVNPALIGDNLDGGFYGSTFNNLFGFSKTTTPQPLDGFFVGEPSVIDKSRGVTLSNWKDMAKAEIARQEVIFGGPLSNSKLVSITDAMRQLAGLPSSFDSTKVQHLADQVTLTKIAEKSVKQLGSATSNVVSNLPDPKLALGTISILGVAAIVIGAVVLFKA